MTRPPSAHSRDRTSDHEDVTDEIQPQIPQQAPSLPAGPAAIESLPAPQAPALLPAVIPPVPRRARAALRYDLLLDGLLYFSAIIVAMFILAGIGFASLGMKPFDGVSKTAYLPWAILSFGSRGNVDDYLGTGWGPRDADGQWTDGPVAQMSVPLRMEGGASISMRVEFDTRIDKREPKFDLQILADGTTVFKQSYRTDGPQVAHFSFKIPPGQARDRLLVTFVQDSPTQIPTDTGADQLRVRLLRVGQPQPDSGN